MQVFAVFLCLFNVINEESLGFGLHVCWTIWSNLKTSHFRKCNENNYNHNNDCIYTALLKKQSAFTDKDMGCSENQTVWIKTIRDLRTIKKVKNNVAKCKKQSNSKNCQKKSSK